MVFEDDDIAMKKNLSVVNDSLMETTIDAINMSTEKTNQHTQINVEYKLKQNEETLTNMEPDNKYSKEYTENEISVNLPVQVCVY